jgi:hypothetical protein
MSYQDGATPLANLCQKAGSTLDEILALDEDELEELSKEIVGNGVLEHARILRQWRRCKLEEDLRNELEMELANEGQESNVPQVREEAQEELRVANDIRQKAQHDVIGESWEEYLRKQIRVELQESEPPPVTNIITGGTRTTASAFTDDNSGDEYETFVESITLDPSLLLESDEDEDAKTTYNPMEPLGSVAADMMGFIENGINSFFQPDLPKKKKKKKQPKSFFESGMEFFYPTEEPENKKSSKKKKEKSLLTDGLAYFVDDTSVDKNKENTKQKNKKKLTTRRSNRWLRQKEQSGETYKLVPTRSLQARHKFHC